MQIPSADIYIHWIVALLQWKYARKEAAFQKLCFEQLATNDFRLLQNIVAADFQISA